jgi:hypothetical protein
VTFEAGRTRRELKTQLLQKCLTTVGSCCATLEGSETQHDLCAVLADHIKKVTEPEICEKLAEVGSELYHPLY